MRGLACQKNVTEKPLHRVVANRTIDTETRSTALLKPEKENQQCIHGHFFPAVFCFLL